MEVVSRAEKKTEGQKRRQKIKLSVEDVSILAGLALTIELTVDEPLSSVGSMTSLTPYFVLLRHLMLVSNVVLTFRGRKTVVVVLSATHKCFHNKEHIC